MALALPDEGSIIALDKNEETNKIAQNFFKKANQNHKIKTIIKPALESLMSIRNEKFDLVFIDADKMNYQKYYEISLDLLNKEGLVIIDNVLWHGEVVNKDINDNREKAIEYKQGKEKLFGFFVGQAMKASGGKANPQLINEILKKKL